MPPTNEPLKILPDGRFQIGVVIVAYASGELLLDCITSVLADALVTGVVVVDNSSELKSKIVVEWLSMNDSRVRYIDPHANLGFASGCNLGTASLKEWTHVFFVNPDVKLTGPLWMLADHLEASSQRIVGGRLISSGHSSRINSRPLVTIPREIEKALVGSRAYKLDWPIVSGRRTDHPFVVGQVDGALLGMSFETHSGLNGFDEQFELYYEDVDICARAESLGGCLFVPTICGQHVGGASSSTVPEVTYCVGAISRARYIRSHFGKSPATTLVILFIALLEFGARTLTSQSEGILTRMKSVRMQVREAMRPGSVSLLGK